MPDPLTPERIAKMHARNAVTAFDANWSSDVPALLAEIERLRARVAALEADATNATAMLVEFERLGDRIIGSSPDDCPAWWNEHFDALHARVESWNAREHAKKEAKP